MELKIVYLPVSDLKPYERNAKLHPAEQIEQIKRSIQDNGMCDPIGVWGPDNLVVEGHGRLLACKELGIDTVPVIRLDHLTDEQRREYALIHNQTTMNSGFDFAILEGELQGLPDFDAEFYGFEADIPPDWFDDAFSLPDGEKSELCTMTFTLHKEQKKLIDYAIEQVAADCNETYGNSNRNGNALHEVVRQWVERKR